MDTPLSVLFAGGGTGGHLYPALAIAEEVKARAPEATITFAGTKGKIEARIVPQKGYAFAPIWISGFRRKITAETLLFPIKLVTALVQSFMLMRKVRPQVVVGTGGYVCGPPVFVASLLGIPTLIQEQNSFPGVTTRLLASRASEVHLTFEGSRRYLKRVDNVHVTGNPTRATIGKVSRDAGASVFGLTPAIPTLLVFGGSLGATSLNNAMVRVLDALKRMNIQVLWQTGNQDAANVAEAVRHAGLEKRIVVRAFIEEMDAAYAVCDLAVCRAGATTLAELTRAGIPSVLVPYPFAAADHQKENARAMVERGAAVMCEDRDLDAKLEGLLVSLLGDPERRKAMAVQAKAMGRPDAAEVLATAVLKLAGVKR